MTFTFPVLLAMLFVQCVALGMACKALYRYIKELG